MLKSREYELLWKLALDMYNDSGDVTFLKKADDYYTMMIIERAKENA